MATPLVVLRAETGSAIGVGHLMRSRAVALALRELDAAPCFVVDDWSSAARLSAEGFEVLLAAERSGWRADGARAAWLDGRSDPSADLEELAAHGTPSFLVESRVAARERAAAVVQPALHFAPDAWERAHPERVLGGAEWIPLAPEVLAAPRAARPDVDLLITFGGSDPRRLTERALRALAGAERNVCVAVGPHMEPRRAEIARLARRAGARVLPAGTALGPWMGRARLALTALGTTLYELAFLRVPALVLANYAADRTALEHYAASGPHRPLGIADDVGDGELRERLAAELSGPAAPAPAVPGLGGGAERLARRLLGAGAQQGRRSA